MKVNLTILKGGNSYEREISLKSFENILKYINKEKYNIQIIDINRDSFKDLILTKEILKFKPDVVFNTLHGGEGEDGTIQGFLTMFNIKYVGSKSLSSGICIDKNLSKIIMKVNNIPIIDQVFIKKGEDFLLYESQIRELSYPIIVKPNRGGGSIGISIAENREELIFAIDKIKKLEDDILIEKFIHGKEVTCCVIQSNKGLTVLPLLDINTNNKFFDYSAKYQDETNIDFSTLPRFLQTMIEEVAKKVFNALKCEGYANIDFIIKEEEIYVLEVNTLPGMTEKSLLPKAVSLLNINFTDFLDSIIEFALNN